jgi:hypothetical protein
VAGPKAGAWGTGMSASARRVRARQRAEQALRDSPNTLSFGESALCDSSDDFLKLNSRLGGGSADLPQAFVLLASDCAWADTATH